MDRNIPDEMNVQENEQQEVVTDYGVVPEEELSRLPENVRYCTPRKEPGTGKKVVLWIMGIVGCLSFLVACAALSVGAVMYTMGYRLVKPSGEIKDDDFIYDYEENDTSETDFQINKSSDAGLGIVVKELESQKAETYGIKGGLVIVGITEHTSFSDTDVQVYDIITGADGKDVVTTLDLTLILYEHEPGDELALTITRFRDGFPESFDLVVTLIDKTEESAQG